MAKLIKCPRCQSQIDVTTMAGGSSVRCPDCGAQVRIPTGETGKHPAKQPAAVAAGGSAAPAAPSRGTARRISSPIFAKMAGAKAPGQGGRGTAVRGAAGTSHNAGMIIGAIVGGIAVIGGLAFVLSSKGDKDTRKNQPFSEAAARTDSKFRAPDQPAGGPPTAPRTADPGSPSFQPPVKWEPNAMRHLPPGQGLIPCSATAGTEAEHILKNEDPRMVMTRPDKYFAPTINCMLSEDEFVARAAFQAISWFCDEKKLKTDSGRNPVQRENINSAQSRAEQFKYWAHDWYPKNKDSLGSEPIAQPGGSLDANTSDWEQIMRDLRGAGAYDDPSRPEGSTMAKIKRMDRKLVYQKLIGYIDHEDPMVGRAACAALNYLTDQKQPLPTEKNKAQIKATWQEWASKN